MKIAICTPHYADVSAAYARSLAKLMLWTAQANITFNGAPTVPQFEVFMRKSTVLPRCRNTLAQDAVDWQANYLLWIDGDHAFPEDGLLRLLAHGLPVVGANYARRARPTLPTAVSLDDRLVWTTRELAEQGAVQRVRHLGLGFCLIDMTVIDTLRQQPGPLFALEMIGDGRQAVAEDVFFFRRVAAAGFDVHLDHGLSWQIGHVYEGMIWNADAEADRPAAERIEANPVGFTDS